MAPRKRQTIGHGIALIGVQFVKPGGAENRVSSILGQIIFVYPIIHFYEASFCLVDSALESMSKKHGAGGRF